MEDVCLTVPGAHAACLTVPGREGALRGTRTQIACARAVVNAPAEEVGKPSHQDPKHPVKELGEQH